MGPVVQCAVCVYLCLYLQYNLCYLFTMGGMQCVVYAVAIACLNTNDNKNMFIYAVLVTIVYYTYKAY